MSDECRVPMIEPEDATGDVKVLYDAVAAMLGRSAQLLSGHGQLAPCGKDVGAFQRGVTAPGSGSVLDTKLKEMVVIKTSHLNGCAY